MNHPWQLFANPDSSRYATDLNALATSARQSFAILEQWQNQKAFDHGLVKLVVDRIVKQGPGYYGAIQKSAETAQQGCSFAADAIAFCDRLTRKEGTLENLQRGLQDIRQMAKRAHEGANDMNKEFKRVRVELFKIEKDIPSNIAMVTSERDKSQRDSSVPEPRLVLLAGSAFDASTSELTCSRPDQDMVTAALSQFKRVTDDLNTLIQQVSCFVNWWGDINTGLANLEDVLPQIRVDGTNPFRTDTVKERWEGVHQQYISYQRQISAVQDYYRNVAGGSTPRSIRDGGRGELDARGWREEKREIMIEGKEADSHTGADARERRKDKQKMTIGEADTRSRIQDHVKVGGGEWRENGERRMNVDDREIKGGVENPKTSEASEEQGWCGCKCIIA